MARVTPRDPGASCFESGGGRPICRVGETYREQTVGGLCEMEDVVAGDGVGGLDFGEDTGLYVAVHLYGAGGGVS